MADGDHEPTVDAFITELNAIRVAAGRPTYEQIDKRSRRLESRSEQVYGVRVKALPRSTTHDILTGHRRRLRLEWVCSYWAVLCVMASESDLDPSRLGTLDYWRLRYEEISVTPDEDDTLPQKSPSEAHRKPLAANRETWSQFTSPTRPEAPDVLTKRPFRDKEELSRALLLRSTKQARTSAWWYDDHRDVVPDWFEIYLSLEPASRLIRTYEPHFIPGLLQTSEYARATILSGHPNATETELAHRVDLRMRRQKILNRPSPLQLWAVIDEHALSSTANTDIMRSQIRYLINISHSQHITIQVMSSDADDHAAADGAVTLLRPHRKDLPDVVYLEQHNYALYPDKVNDVRHYWHVLSRLAMEAEQPRRTIETLHRILDEI